MVVNHSRVGYLTRSVYARRKLTYLTRVHSYPPTSAQQQAMLLPHDSALVSCVPGRHVCRHTGVGRNIRRDLIKTPSRRHFESKRTSKTGSTSKIGSRNGFVRFGNFCIFRSLSPHGVLNSGHKLTVTYYGEITIEPILNPEFDVDHDFEVKTGCFQSLISGCGSGRSMIRLDKRGKQRTRVSVLKR